MLLDSFKLKNIRVNRIEYPIYFCINFLIFLPIFIAIFTLHVMYQNANSLTLMLTVISCLLALLWLRLMSRRLNDTGFSRIWMFVPVCYFTYIYFLAQIDCGSSYVLPMARLSYMSIPYFIFIEALLFIKSSPSASSRTLPSLRLKANLVVGIFLYHAINIFLIFNVFIMADINCDPWAIY